MGNHNNEIKILLNKLAAGTISMQGKKKLAEWAKDDSFLQEALEGYAQSNGDHAENIRELERIIEAKRNSSKSKFSLYRWRIEIAASALLLISAAAVVYFSQPFSTKNKPLAFDTVAEKTETSPSLPSGGQIAEEQSSSAGVDEYEKSTDVAQVDDVAKKVHESVSRDNTGHDEKAFAFSDQAPIEDSRLMGQVLDQTGSPLIGAEIRLRQRDSSIYTDREGRFILTPINSREHLVISYAGYLSKEIEKINEEKLDSIILVENPVVMNEIAMSNASQAAEEADTRASKSRRASSVHSDTDSEIFPQTGWPKYLAYLRQNINIPEAAKKANISGMVELTFSVDQQGRPIDILIEKSLGYGCDQEAIRLLEDGPVWHQPVSKTSRAYLTIQF